MKKSKVRAGIVGAGFAANFHVNAIHRVYGTDPEIVGVTSRSIETARAFAEPRGLRAFDRMEALLEEVDVVHVCVPASAHETVAIAALTRGVAPIVEKPFTGFFGDGSAQFDARTVPRQHALDGALDSVKRMLEAEAASTARILYAENWVYVPAIQKEREVLEKTGGQVLWMHGEEAHSGSHSPVYGYWRFGGGGSLIGKGCHPLTAALYLKRVEGRARNGKPIRPISITARTHEITRLDNFIDVGLIRTDYFDVEDFSMQHVTFEDGTIATIFASELVLGGIHNWLEVVANNHRTVCSINPNTAMQTYNPKEEQFRHIYVVEKIETKQGWAMTAPDEDFSTGFPQEIDAFYRAVASGGPIESGSALGADTVATIYAGYLSAEQGGAETSITLL
ncbi:Gfo/Idh/MocA family oxidoreductase [Ponticaulis sp.]|uniref:Gfo/Idh/MocA family protein n=1 Tax=Ponticaulis sp. TaxID=2020902 RepID=UPI000C376AC0|nr:Gfo/Idh/MocA family oxidoreductase [Ponticaulis sp.]MBN06131.1 oxidoreductase [Ponticaulis sp.]